MVELLVSKNVLSDILYENKTFKRALSDQCFSKKEHSDIRRAVSGLVGCELRHHFLFKKVLDKLHIELTLDERTFLYLALANNHFLKALNIKAVNDHLKDVFKEKFEQVEFLLSPELNLFDYVDINKKSFDYISIRFNLPKWLLKSWAKEIGLSKTYRIIHFLSKPMGQCYRLNPYNDHAKALLEKNKDVLGQEIYPGVVSLSHKTIQQHQELKGEHLIEMDYHIKQMVDQVQSQLIEEVCVYSDEDDSLPLELLARGKDKLGINVVCPHMKKEQSLFVQFVYKKRKTLMFLRALTLSQ